MEPQALDITRQAQDGTLPQAPAQAQPEPPTQPAVQPAPADPQPQADPKEAPQEPQAPAEPAPSQPEPQPQPEAEPQFQQPGPVDLSQLPRNENGEIDPQDFLSYSMQLNSQAARVAARAEFAEQETEKKLWREAEKSYPELKAKPELRELVKQARYGSFAEQLATGKQAAMPSPQQVADGLFKEIGTARQQGVEQAQTNISIQKTAQLESSSVSSRGEATDTNSAWNALGSADKNVSDSARDAIIKSMFDSGKLKLPE